MECRTTGSRQLDWPVTAVTVIRWPSLAVLDGPQEPVELLPFARRPPLGGEHSRPEVHYTGYVADLAGTFNRDVCTPSLFPLAVVFSG